MQPPALTISQNQLKSRQILIEFLIRRCLVPSGGLRGRAGRPEETLMEPPRTAAPPLPPPTRPTLQGLKIPHPTAARQDKDIKYGIIFIQTASRNSPREVTQARWGCKSQPGVTGPSITLIQLLKKIIQE